MKGLKKLVIAFGLLLVVNLIGFNVFKRFDLTQDKRYTLSKNTLNIINNLQEEIYIDVFLEGNLPGEIKRLQTETRQLLDEFRAYNPNIQFGFVNPLKDVSNEEQVIQAFFEQGMTPINVTIDDKGKQTQSLIFPWAMAYSEQSDAKIGLLKNMLGASTEDKVMSSVQHLEYALVNAINRVTSAKEKSIAVIKSHGTLEDVYIADALKTFREQYFIAPFSLDSVQINPEKTFSQLKKFDLVLLPKPTKTFSEETKLVLDQYLLSGGKGLFLIDAVAADTDSLYNPNANAFAYVRDLNLNDFFFKYGIRINPVIIQDVLSTPITLATGEQGSKTQYNQYPWLYAPYIYPELKHPITHNVDGIKFEFTSPIDTLKNQNKKTILLISSTNSRTVGVPREISLSEVSNLPNPEEFKTQGNFPVAVLVEGNFTSVYKNRILPFGIKSYQEQGFNNQLIVVSDGDVIKNQLDQNYQPLELGFDKWTKNVFGNKEFIVNCVNYLLDDKGLIEVRNKEVNLALLDKDKIYINYTQNQVLSLLLPTVLVLLVALFFIVKRRQYQRNIKTN